MLFFWVPEVLVRDVHEEDQKRLFLYFPNELPEWYGLLGGFASMTQEDVSGAMKQDTLEFFGYDSSELVHLELKNQPGCCSNICSGADACSFTFWNHSQPGPSCDERMTYSGWEGGGPSRSSIIPLNEANHAWNDTKIGYKMWVSLLQNRAL